MSSERVVLPVEGLTEAGLRSRFGSDVSKNEWFQPDCLELRNALYTLAEQRGWTPGEIQMVELAEMVAIESVKWKMENKKKSRFDGSSWASHLYEIAVRVTERGMDARVAAIALMHDAIEDSKDYPEGYQITEGLLLTLFAKYDPTIAHSVELLTKLKTTYQDSNQPLKTHQRLYELISHDPFSIVVKLEDRIHYMKTARKGKMNPRSIRMKAAETMEYYVPLAVGFGMHDIARELGDLCAPKILKQKHNKTEHRMPHNESAYGDSLSVLNTKIAQYTQLENDHGITSFSDKIPNLADAWRVCHGKLDNIETAWIPAYFTVVLKDHDHPQLYRSEYSFVTYAQRFLSYLEKEGVVQSDDMKQFSELLSSGVQRTTHIDIHIGGVPIRFRFVMESEEIKWQSSLLDALYELPGRERYREAAHQKIQRLQQMFTYYTSSDMRGYRMLRNLKECLEKGTTIVEVADGAGEHMALPANSTALDLAIAYLDASDIDSILAVERETQPDRWEVVSFSEEVSDFGHYRIKLSQEANHHLNVSTLDAVATKYGLEQLQSVIRKRLGKNGETDMILAEDLVKRGKQTVYGIYKRLGHEDGIKEPYMRAPIRIASDVMRDVYMKYHIPGVKHQRVVNALIRIGMRELPLDSGRTSIVWNIGKTIYEREKKFIPVTIPVPHASGQLGKVSSAFGEQGINIQYLEVDFDDELSAEPDAQLFILMSPADYRKYMRLGGIDWIRSIAS